MNFAGKNITVVGAKRSGVGAAKLIKRFGGKPFVTDSATGTMLNEFIEMLKANNIEYETGIHSEKAFDCELMVVSPGVPSNAEIIKSAREKKIKIIGELELASSVCRGNIIAITGTNGKTTTTSLCGHLFNTCGKKTYVAGNIGVAFSEIASDIKEDEFVALEVSSFQLDLIENFKPKIAMILNITPDHLNRYEYKMENYITSKLQVYKNQDESDFLILNKDNDTLMDSVTPHKSKSYYFSLKETLNNGTYNFGDDIFFNEDSNLKFNCLVSDINLLGEHNVANSMAVITAAKIFGLDNDKIIKALRTFEGVEHRLEFVREIEGVKYINDSKATNVDSVWYALKGLPGQIFLILGGQDKGNDYNQIRQLVLEKVIKIYAIGSSADIVFNFFHRDIKVEVKQTMEDVIHAANLEARPGDIVLLSPACASFDMYDNYEHRGKVFKEAVNKL
ncbi:MAG TPA: UDP-N-acetylmuramoyl-L-alanine--D-glutamate ligase [Ignavibacteriaceae bacterium]|nr:UDP-N-acetylmuramoyl-L-alanine--D-glutamate ligase [Ignavibacteriaceae bacterium]